MLYLFGEFLCLGVVQLAVDVPDVPLQPAELLAQLVHSQVCVQALVLQVPVGLQALCHVLYHSHDLREALVGQLHLKERHRQRLFRLKVYSEVFFITIWVLLLYR